MPPLLPLLLVVSGAALVALVVYWLLFVTEGAYLGERVVVWLYDVYARRYDRIKAWDSSDEVLYLAWPFVMAVGPRRQPPLILDVAAGTGRLARAVEATGVLPDARWVLLDASTRMLAEARKHLALGQRGHFIAHSARRLPFEDDTFDVVACLEALEFMPQPAAVLAELARVLRPGGLLLITNRIGHVARLMPGRTWSHTHIYHLHKELGLNHVSIRPFLVDYEWISSTKSGRFHPPGRAHDADAIARLEALANLHYNVTDTMSDAASRRDARP